MNAEAKAVSVSIMDKEYLVACSESERESLFSTVEYLNGKLRELREGGKVIGSERIAVMAALNVAHEYLEYRKEKEDYTLSMDSGLQRLENKISGVLKKEQQLEL